MPLRASCPGTVTCAGMTDLAAAARAGLWCWPQQAPGLPRGACRHCACAPLSKRPGSPSLGFSLYTVLAQDYNKINMRSMFGLFPANRGAACGQFHPSLRAQGVHCAVPGRHPARGAVSRRNPQRFHRTRTGIRPLRTRHPHVCAQKARCRAVAVRDHRPADPAVPALLARRPGTRSCGRALRKVRRGPRRGRGRFRAYRLRVAAQPSGNIAPAPGGDPGSSRLALRLLAGVVRSWHTRSCRAESGRAPPCMRWRGPARPRRARPASCLAVPRRVPPAGARYPCERPVARFLPRSRGHPQVVPVSNGESISTASASATQGACGQEFRVFPLSTRHPQKAGSYPHQVMVIRRLIHSPSTGHRAYLTNIRSRCALTTSG